MGLNTLFLNSNNILEYINRLRVLKETNIYIDTITRIVSNGNVKSSFKFKYDFHIHSIYSDGIDSPENIVKYAKKIGLTKIAITDHNTIRGGVEGKEIDPNYVIIGSEISSEECDILALNIIDDIKPFQSVKKTIDAIHEQGGFAIVAHPYDILRSRLKNLDLLSYFDAIEIINGCTIAMNSPSHIINNFKLLSFSDAHRIEEIGLAYTSTNHFLESKELFFKDNGIKTNLCGRNLSYGKYLSLRLSLYCHRKSNIICELYKNYRRYKINHNIFIEKKKIAI